MDQALATPALFNWTSRWGIPFWTGLGFTVPANVRTWAWSVISPREEVYWDDPAGNQHPIGEGKVSHIWSLDPSGQRFSYIDPWLPLDRSYEMCGPYRGRLQASSLSTSGSVVFAMNSFGDLYTRTYDFDISGPDNLFFRYSYEDQRGVSDPAIQLPPAAWVQQPKIPGRITNRDQHREGGARHAPSHAARRGPGRGRAHGLLGEGRGRAGPGRLALRVHRRAADRHRDPQPGGRCIRPHARGRRGRALRRRHGRDPRLQHLLQPGGAAGPAGRRPAGGPDPPRRRSDPDLAAGAGARFVAAPGVGDDRGAAGGAVAFRRAAVCRCGRFCNEG